MEKCIVVKGLPIAKPLYDVVYIDLAPGNKIDTNDVREKRAEIVTGLAPQNRIINY